MSGTEIAQTSHAEEEQCLFFVATSRARLHLRIYHCRKQPNGNARTPSEYLDWLKPLHLDSVPSPATMPLPPDAPRLTAIFVTWATDWKITQSRLTSYKKCPRRFFYTHVLRLGGARKTTAFSQTHDCLYEFIRWLAAERLKGPINRDMALAEFAKVWGSKGPVDHAFANDYRKLAERIAEALLASGGGRQFRAVEELPIILSGGSVIVTPDSLTADAGGKMTLHRIRTGYKRSKEYEDDLEYGLYHLAAQARYGTAYSVEALHLSDELSEEVQPFTSRVLGNRKKTSQELVTGIVGGFFQPDPESVKCPRCPHFFICAAEGRGPLTQI